MCLKDIRNSLLTQQCVKEEKMRWMPTVAVASLLSGVGLANSEAIRRWNWFKATECKKLEVTWGSLTVT